MEFMPRTTMVGLATLVLYIFYIEGVTSQFISKPPSNVNSTIGGSVTFECTVGNRTNALLTWQRLGDPATLLFSNTRKIYRIPGETRETQKYKAALTVQKDGNVTYTLTVNDVQNVDNASFMCMVLKNKRPSATADLLVLLPPKFELGTPRLTKTVEGENATLFCNVSGSPQPRVTWSRSDGRPMPIGESSMNGAKFYIEAVNKNDAGTYICKAENGVPPNPIRLDVKMEVSFPAKVRAIRKEVGQQPNKGYEAHLLCVATGYPRPGTRWFRVLDDGSEKEIVADFKKYSMQMIAGVEKLNHDIQVQLTVHKVVHDDFGNYTCRVSNAYGQDNAYILFYKLDGVSYVPGSDAHIESKALSDPDSNVKDTRYVMDEKESGCGHLTSSTVLTLMLLVLVHVT